MVETYDAELWTEFFTCSLIFVGLLVSAPSEWLPVLTLALYVQWIQATLCLCLSSSSSQSFSRWQRMANGAAILSHKHPQFSYLPCCPCCTGSGTPSHTLITSRTTPAITGKPIERHSRYSSWSRLRLHTDSHWSESEEYKLESGQRN
jgi:hypothetical protein